MTAKTFISFNLLHHLALLQRNYLEPTDSMADTRNNVPLAYSAMYQINSLNTCMAQAHLEEPSRLWNRQ
jgi:hypothetical protein